MREQVTEVYQNALIADANTARTATTAEGLAPYGALEDTLRTVLEDARMADDSEATAKYEPMLEQVGTEIDAIVSQLFTEDLCTRVGNRMDMKAVPAVTVTTTRGKAGLLVEAGVPTTLWLSTIGNNLFAALPVGAVHQEDLAASRSRKGAPAIILEPGSSVTITKLRARRLR